MTKTKILIFFCCKLFLTCNVYAQQPAYTYYTLHDGLPSNEIYNCVEDKKGFLWLATQNGLARFDGKNFKNYYSAQGLPDNDILNVLVDSAGVVWVLPFQRTPAYYDEKTDRFVNSTTDKELQKILFSNVNSCNALSGGGIAFCNSKGEVFIYKNKKTTEYNFHYPLKNYISRVISLPNDKLLFISSDSLRIIKNSKIISRQYLNKAVLLSAFVNNNLYLADSTRFFKVAIDENGNMKQQIEINLPFVINTLNFTGKQIAISSSNSNIYLADTATLIFSQQAFSFNNMPRSITEDNVGNTWICTKENGIIRYQQKGILSISNPAFQRNFNTITFLKNTIVAGTNEGMIFLYNGPYNYRTINLRAYKDYTRWIRRMAATKNGIIIGAEGGLYLLDNNLKLKEYNTKNIASKDVFAYNDSIIIAGNSGQATITNIITNKNEGFVKIRVTALQAPAINNIYIGSNTGLYKWENLHNLKNFGLSYPLLTTRISSLAYNTVDEILWTGLATDSLVAIYKDKPIGIIPLGAKLPGNNCRALYSKKKGIVWVGTNTALGRIEYNRMNDKLTYKISVFTTADGLAGKQINDIIERNDTIYVATTAGISMVPSFMHIKAIDIPVYVTTVNINTHDTILQKEYDLNYNQNNISLNFSTADLGSTTERTYEYRINDGAWLSTTIENISLQQLAPGNYNIQIRAIKRDGTASAKTTEMIFKIQTPFWENILFRLLLFVVIIGLLLYVMQKRNKLKRQRGIQQLLTEKKLTDLELKALKAQINPHFVFNCLNSIKYLNYQKKFEETEMYLDKFSYLLRKTLDYSGLQKISLKDELLYSKNYLALEKLRLGNKMMYEIVIDKNINVEEVLVPPMLMQPYLENAIKHGIRHLSKKQGVIVIEIKMLAGEIICLIKDNGIGIGMSKTIADNKNYTSHGLTLQQRRAELYNVQVCIKPLEEGAGTIVSLTLKQ